MRAEFDSRADALQIYLDEAPRWTDGEDIAGAWVDYAPGGRPSGIELLAPRGGLQPLRAAAERLGLDGEALVAGACAAVAAPDRTVTVAVAGRAVA